MKTIITARQNFELAHNLFPYEGNCASIHGHSYNVEVSVTGQQDELGMVLDFRELKDIMKEVIPDHAYMYQENSGDSFTEEIVAVMKKHNKRIASYEQQTTAENNAFEWGRQIQERLTYKYRNAYKVTLVKVYETARNCAEYNFEEGPVNG